MRNVNTVIHHTGNVQNLSAYLDHVEESCGSLPDNLVECRKQLEGIQTGVRVSLEGPVLSKVIRIPGQRQIIRYFLEKPLSGNFYTKLTCPAFIFQKHMGHIFREHPILELQLSEVDWTCDPMTVTCEYLQGFETIHLNAPRLTLAAITWIKKLRLYSCKTLHLVGDPAIKRVVAIQLEKHYPQMEVV